jgi:hypothetical protein
LNAKDQVLRSSILAQFSIYTVLHTEHFFEFVRRNGDGSLTTFARVTQGSWRVSYNGIECVWSFPYVELLVITLALSCSHVIHDGVSPDVIHSIVFTDTKTVFSHDNSEFTFIISCASELWTWVDTVAIGNGR